MFDKINQAIVRHLEARRGAPSVDAVELSDDGFVVKRRDGGGTMAPLRIRWGEVRQAAAVLAPGAVGGDECLLVEGTAGLVQLTPGVNGFEAFVEAAPRHLPGWKAVQQWRTELIAADAGAAVPVYR